MSIHNKIKVAIIGATGYTGLDLVYILSKHPRVNIKQLCATKNLGKEISFFDKRLKKKFPKIKGPIKEDICYATTNRQSAVKKIASKCDIFFVLGSRNSSNSVRLVEVAKKAGCKNSLLMHSEREIPFDKIDSSNIIGISSGASAPEKLVQTLLNNIKKNRNVSIEEVVVAEEKVIFKLPKELN